MTAVAPSGTARLAYDAVGDGPAALLLHAGVNDRRSWHHVIDDLSPTRRTIAYDRRGYGETTYEAETHSEVDDAVAVLDHAGVDGPVSVVGCSMGGRLAIDLVLAHPERVDRLVLIGAGCRGAPEPDLQPEHEMELERAIELADDAGDLDTVNQLEAWFWLDGPSAREHRVSGPTRELFLEMNGIALRAAPAGDEVELRTAWDHLDEITIPTLVLVGELDIDEAFDTGQGLAERIADARFVMLEETAHVPHLEGHAHCREQIRAHLSS